MVGEYRTRSVGYAELLESAPDTREIANEIEAAAHEIYDISDTARESELPDRQGRV